MSEKFWVRFFWTILAASAMGCNDVSDLPDEDSSILQDTNSETSTADSETASETAFENGTGGSDTETESNRIEDSDDPQCYSPEQNLDRADDVDAVGCACDPGLNQDICADGVGLMCRDFRWQSVEDGPCMALEYDCFFPENPYSVRLASEGCECDPEVDKPICDGYAFICSENHWITVIDGPCGM